MSEQPDRNPAQSNPYYGGNQPGDQQPVDPRNPKRGGINQLVNYQFSPEEMRVLRECETESFYQRSLPLGFGLGLGAFLGVRNGILKPSARFGSWPKVIAFSFLGYVAGRLSYQKTCQEKMLALPNSRFAEMLRQRLNRSDKKWDSTDAGVATAFSLAPFQSNTDVYSDHNQPNSLNLDTSRPSYSSLDDTYMPTMEGKNDMNEDLNIPSRKNTVTYDELRQKNRDEYMKNQPNSYYRQRLGPSSSPQPPGNVPPNDSSGNQPFSDLDRRRSNLRSGGDDEFPRTKSSGPTNKYGDSWSE